MNACVQVFLSIYFVLDVTFSVDALPLNHWCHSSADLFWIFWLIVGLNHPLMTEFLLWWSDCPFQYQYPISYTSLWHWLFSLVMKYVLDSYPWASLSWAWLVDSFISDLRRVLLVSPAHVVLLFASIRCWSLSYQWIVQLDALQVLLFFT